jgi:hypothetical protein
LRTCSRPRMRRSRFTSASFSRSGSVACERLVASHALGDLARVDRLQVRGYGGVVAARRRARSRSRPRSLRKAATGRFRRRGRRPRVSSGSQRLRRAW